MLISYFPKVWTAVWDTDRERFRLEADRTTQKWLVVSYRLRLSGKGSWNFYCSWGINELFLPLPKISDVSRSTVGYAQLKRTENFTLSQCQVRNPFSSELCWYMSRFCVRRPIQELFWSPVVFLIQYFKSLRNNLMWRDLCVCDMYRGGPLSGSIRLPVCLLSGTPWFRQENFSRSLVLSMVNNSIIGYYFPKHNRKFRHLYRKIHNWRFAEKRPKNQVKKNEKM